jgi:PEP-CTERM motif
MFRIGAFLTGILCCTSAFAGTVDLIDAFVYLDGTSYELGLANPPGSVDLSAFSPTNFASPGSGYNGLGTITVTLTGGGIHNIVVYFDHDLNNLANGAFNEFGVANGVLPAGFSWQLGDPNDISVNPTDIWAQAAAGNLLNRNDVGTPIPPPNICCDVAMAEGASFNLNSNQTAVLTFTTSQTKPGSGFYLSQFDVPGLTDSPANLTPGDAVYLQGSLNITTTRGGSDTPEPGTIALLLSGLGAIAFTRVRRRA